MVTKFAIYGIIIMSLILIFSFIHLGVSIGIISENRSYNDMFRPEIGLSSFNIVISFLGIVVSALGLFCLLTNQGVLRKIVAVISGILGIFALVSLVTALIINAKSVSYVNTRFFNNMNQYSNNSDAQNIIDRIQTNYECCGGTTWLDWARFQSGNTTISTSTSTTVTTTTSTIVTTTTLAVTTSTTSFQQVTTPMTLSPASTTPATTPEQSNTPSTLTAESTTSSTPSGEITTPATTPEQSNTPSTLTVESTTSVIASKKDAINMSQAGSSAISTRKNLNVRRQVYPLDLSPDLSILNIRRPRQAVSSSINMISVPYSNQFSVPTTCCNNQGSSNSSQSTCTSSTQFYTNGCLRFIVKRANEQDMGIGIINSFMVVLAFVAIPFLIHGDLTSDSQDNEVYKYQLEHLKQFDSDAQHFVSIVNTYH